MFAKRKISFLAVAALLSACSDYVDKIEKDYKEQYGDTEKYFENLNKVDADLASICESDTWFWCATRNGAYVTSNNGFIEQYSSGDARFTFLAVDDNSYDYSTNTLDDNLLPYLRRDGGISVSVTGSGDFEAGLKINTGDYFSALAENNVVIAYENNCSGVKVNLDVVATTDYMWKNKVVAEGTVVYRLSKELQTSGLLVQTLDPDQLTIEVGDNDWRTIASSISSSENKDKLTSVITVEFTKSCADDTHGITFIGAGLVPTQRSVSSSSNKDGTTTSSSSTEKIELAGNLITCAPEVSKVKVGESVKWEFTLSSEARNLIGAAAINVAHSEWTLDGGEPSTSVKDGPSNISSQITYSTSGTKKASLDYTARNYHGTFTCSTLEVVENETASSSSTAKSSSSVTPDNPTATGFLWDGSKKSDFVKTDFGSGNKWFIFTDADTDSGSTYVSVPEINPYDVCLGKCIGVKFGEPVGNNERQPYAGVGFDLGESGAIYDVSGWQGICIAYQSIITSQSSAELRVDLRPYDPNYYGYNIPAHTLPVNVTGLGADYHIENILWSEFAQRWSGPEELSGEEVATMLRGISITLESNPNTVAFFNVYQIGSYGQCGQVRATSVDMSLFPFPESSSSSSGENPGDNTSWCGDLWCGATDTQGKVNTGFDERAGYWFVFDDSRDKGNSNIFFPADVEENEYGNFFGPLIETYKGIIGEVHLGDGYDYPYVGFGFNVYDEYGTGTDISDWSGFCLVYRSTIGFSIEIVPENDSAVTGYNNYKATVPKSSTITAANFPWAKFKQGSGWGKTVDQSTVLADVSNIRLKFEGTAGTSGVAEIYSIGRPGTCSQPPDYSSSSSYIFASSSSSSESNPAWEYLNPAIEYGEFTDERDGHVYKTIDVGNYTWFAQNLNLEYNDGEGNSCPGSDPDSCAKYGRMYTWAAAMDSVGIYSTKAQGCGRGVDCAIILPHRGICPEGWHIPSNAEWEILLDSAGGDTIAAPVLKSQMGWRSNGSNTSGTNDLGFSAIPSGPDEYGLFWSSTRNSNIYGYRLRLFSGADLKASIGDGAKDDAMAVRCVKETVPRPVSGMFIDDRDGQEYPYIRINTQTWMAKNLNFATDSSACFGNDTANCNMFGRLYIWEAAVAKSSEECGYDKNCNLPATGYIRGVCPEGWHLPRISELETLIDAAGGGGDAGRVLKSPDTWNYYDDDYTGTNETGFNALCAGMRNDNGVFMSDGMYTYYWSASETNSSRARYMQLYYYGKSAGTNSEYKDNYYSVRCVQNEPAFGGAYHQ